MIDFKITVTRKKRTCSFCREDIPKGSVVVEKYEIILDEAWPRKDNFCENCFKEVIGPKLIRLAQTILATVGKAERDIERKKDGL